MIYIFDLPFVVLFPCFVFWVVCFWFLGAFAIRGSIELYEKLFPKQTRYYYNEDSHELGLQHDNEIEPIGIVTEYDYTTPRELVED